jgi:hypothetical protein
MLKKSRIKIDRPLFSIGTEDANPALSAGLCAARQSIGGGIFRMISNYALTSPANSSSENSINYNLSYALDPYPVSLE